jgi:hypothetical protein
MPLVQHFVHGIKFRNSVPVSEVSSRIKKTLANPVSSNTDVK